MNYFTHALPFLDDPYFIAGANVPDWLSVADRRVRVRAKFATPIADEPNGPAASVARGVLQHFRDDARFHRTRAFTETSLELSATIRRITLGDSGFRPSFVGHILVEMLLDWVLMTENPDDLHAYYRALEAVDAYAVQDAANRMARQSTDRLAPVIFFFREERILWDYMEDDKLLVRMNQVMRRVRFDPLPADFLGILPGARELIRRRRRELLDGIPALAESIAGSR